MILQVKGTISGTLTSSSIEPPSPESCRSRDKLTLSLFCIGRFGFEKSYEIRHSLNLYLSAIY